MTRRFSRRIARTPILPHGQCDFDPQSYLSLEYILQRNAILTEMTYPVTAVTLKQTRVSKQTGNLYLPQYQSQSLSGLYIFRIHGHSNSPGNGGKGAL